MPPEKMPSGDPTVEITVCVYPGGKLALRIDNGDKVPVKSLDMAVMAVRKLVESEMGEGIQKESMEPPDEEGAESEQAFQQGFKGGGY
jgi:hypothetical protein